MKLHLGIGASLLVVAASLPLTAAFTPPQAPADAPAQTAPSIEAPPELQKPDLPSWAYTPQNAAAIHKRVDDGTPLHVPSSTLGFTRTITTDLFNPPDWFPDAHPPMPPVVAKGRKPTVSACSYCHYPNGAGRPENESLAGLPTSYILQQMADFKANRRHNSVPGMAIFSMIPIAATATPEEAQVAAEYFSKLKPVKFVRVVETDTVPKTHPLAWMMVADEAGGTEPIGNRVIEMPEDLNLTQLRDSMSGFVAYVPTGTLRKGEDLVKNGGGGKTMACTICHGTALKGSGNVPSIAGRSPSAIARQLYDFQTGARNGPNAVLMKAPVAKLTDADIVAITGYLASLEP